MKKIQAMREGGVRLGELTAKVYDYLNTEVSPHEIEIYTQKLIKQAGGTPSFSTISDYNWATCININEGVVHGIPSSNEKFHDGDVVMVDIGLLYEGFHTDNAFTKVVGTSTQEKNNFLQAGKDALQAGISKVEPGLHIGEISKAYQEILHTYGFEPARGLTGHGIGKNLHQDPMIPCLLLEPIDNTPMLRLGQTIALEIIYLAGSPELKLDSDGWTISTSDGKLSAVFEETVEVTDDGGAILTKPALFQR